MTLTSFITSLIMVAVAWTPTDVVQFWTNPNEPAVFHFKANEPPGEDAVKFEFRTTDGELALVGMGKVDGASLAVQATLPQGYYELTLPESNQTFGVACQPPYDATTVRERDAFFAIDAASTWLVHDDSVREALLKNARRMGLATYRERLNWIRIENKEGVFDFEGDNRSEKLRKLAEQNGMPVLELFHNAPGWTGLVGKFPEDLIKTSDAWGVIGKRWERYWNSFEVWNEPDIGFSGNLPADQYVPLLKTIANEFARQGIETPIVGGIIASFRDDYMDSLADNGALDACDYFSFHTYCRAYEMENVSLRYLRWLEKNNAEWKPVWITECGRPWSKGANRPNRESDLLSAIDIVEKGVAAKALGVDAYFPFVYVYYEENDNNFGMSDFSNAPLRSIAGYARSVSLLGGKRCIGSLSFPHDIVERSYLFVDSQTNEKVAVLYSRDRREGRRLRLPCNPLFVERITGERLNVSEDGTVDFRDGFLFVGLPSNLELKLAKPTEIDAMRNLRVAARVKHGADPRRNFSTVLRYDFDASVVSVDRGGYKMHDSKADAFSGNLSVFNFDVQEKILPLSLDFVVQDENGAMTSRRALATIPEEVIVPPRGRATAPFSVATSDVSPFAESKLIFRAGDDAVLTFAISRPVDEDSFRTFATLVCPLDISDLNRWRKSSSKNGLLEFCEGLSTDASSDKSWGVVARFSDESDRWAYPVFTLPLTNDTKKLKLFDNQGCVTERSLAEFKGIAFRVKGTSSNKESVLRFFTYSEQGNYYYTGVPFAPADGEERFIVIPFSSLTPYGGVGEQFDASRVHSISFGCNARGEEITIQLGDVFLFK